MKRLNYKHWAPPALSKNQTNSGTDLSLWLSNVGD